MRRRGRDHARSARRASIPIQPLLYASNVAAMPIMTLLVARLAFAILDTLVMDRAARLVRRASSRRPQAMMIVLHVLARSQSQIPEPWNAGSLNARMIQTGRAKDMVTLAICMPLVNRMKATAVTTARATHVAALARRTKPVLGKLFCTLFSRLECQSDSAGKQIFRMFENKSCPKYREHVPEYRTSF